MHDIVYISLKEKRTEETSRALFNEMEYNLYIYMHTAVFNSIIAPFLKNERCILCLAVFYQCLCEQLRPDCMAVLDTS